MVVEKPIDLHLDSWEASLYHLSGHTRTAGTKQSIVNSWNFINLKSQRNIFTDKLVKEWGLKSFEQHGAERILSTEAVLS